jgi:hypothetical protein
VVDVCGTSLVDATTYMEDAFESVAFAAAPAPERNELLTPPLTKRFGFANQKDPEEVRRETHELFHSKLELIEELALINMLEQPAAEKKAPLKCDHARAPQEPVQGLRYGPLRARVQEEPVQGLRYGPLHARATQEQVQGLRYGLLLARAPEGLLQGLRYGPLRAPAPEGSLQGLRHGLLPARAPERPVQ